MIEYIVPQNIDDRVIAKAARVLQGGGILALPTDTTWVVACSMHSKDGIKKMRRLSGERNERHFTLLCSDIAEFGNLCSIDNTRFRLLKKYSPGPYVFILRTLHGTEKALGLKRPEVGVRIPNHTVPRAVVQALGSPLYSITAKKTMCGEGGDDTHDYTDDDADDSIDDANLRPIPEDQLFEGGWELEAIDGLDLILDGGEELQRVFSTVLDLTGDEAALIRHGAGEFPV